MAEGFLPYRRSSAPNSQGISPERNNNSVESDSNMSANRSGLSLPLTTVPHMAIPIYTAPSRRDVEVGGRVLFQNFIHEELAQEGLSDDVIEIDNPPPDAFENVHEFAAQAGGDAIYARRAESPALVGTPEGFNNSNFMTLGATIRDIADQFAVSHQRTLIREQADQVDLAHINQATFRHMLSELFRHGIDKYCIVALFYFCSDVLIRCVRSELHRLGSKLFFWALQFLIENVCKWVYEHGGWERVFSNIYNAALKMGAVVALGVFIVCGIIYVRKNL